MKFAFGDTAIFADDFAAYTGRIVAHRYRRYWHNLWFKESWYEVNIFDINGEPAIGSILMPEKALKTPEEFKNTKKKVKLTAIKGFKKD